MFIKYLKTFNLNVFGFFLVFHFAEKLNSLSLTGAGPWSTLKMLQSISGWRGTKKRRKVRFVVCRVRWIFHHVARGLCKRGGVNRRKRHGAAATTATQTPTHSGHNTQFKDDKATVRAPTRALCGIVAIVAESFLASAPVTPVEVIAVPSLATQLRVFCLYAFVSVCAGKKK